MHSFIFYSVFFVWTLSLSIYLKKFTLTFEFLKQQSANFASFMDSAGFILRSTE